jgi:hypothetical protein
MSNDLDDPMQTTIEEYELGEFSKYGDIMDDIIQRLWV